MSEILIWELEFVVVSFLVGYGIRALYDLVLIFRSIVKHTVLWVSLEDIAFCVFAVLKIFELYYRMNFGEWRGFSLLTIGLGMWLCHKTLSRIIQRILQNFVKKVVGKRRKGD